MTHDVCIMRHMTHIITHMAHMCMSHDSWRVYHTIGRVMWGIILVCVSYVCHICYDIMWGIVLVHMWMSPVRYTSTMPVYDTSQDSLSLGRARHSCGSYITHIWHTCDTLTSTIPYMTIVDMHTQWVMWGVVLVHMWMSHSFPVRYRRHAHTYTYDTHTTHLQYTHTHVDESCKVSYSYVCRKSVICVSYMCHMCVPPDPINHLCSLTGKWISENHFTYRSVQYLKSCSGDFILQNLILRTRLCGTGFITQHSCVFDFRLTEICQAEMICMGGVPGLKCISAGPALK